MSLNMSSVSSYLLLLCFFLPSFSAAALNISEILEKYPDFRSFSIHLRETGLADSVNGGKKITVLAVDNRAMSKISGGPTEEVERLLRLHLVRGYYRARHLLQLTNGTASLPTFSQDDLVRVKALRGGGVGFSAAGEGPGLGAELLKPVFSHPKDRVAVLHVSDLIRQQDNASGNCLTFCASARSKKVEALPISTVFKLPAPLPSWPAGKGFASGTIDLGGLLVQQTTTFTKVWATHEGGPDNLGATFFEPSLLPEGYFMLGSYAQPNNKPLFGGILIGKDGTNSLTNGTLKKPINYTLVWSSESLKINQEGSGYIWLPVPPDGYTAVGHVVTTSSEKPSTDKVRCIRSDLTDHCETDTWIWGNGNAINVFTSRPSIRGIEARGVGVGAFFAQASAPNSSVLACLRNTKFDSSSMPNQNQIEALVREYSPLVYFHSDEAFLPSSVGWFFTNGALLYKKEEETKPVPIEMTGSNLPQGGSSDGTYWLDLPLEGAAKDRVKKGELQSSQAYLHVKPMLGATFTDIAMWIFYPFNGPARAKVKFFDISLGRLGEHVGDWEHLTLRISNFDGRLWSVYLAEHSAGIWVSAAELEYQNSSTNKFVAYSSLHGHALYFKPGMFLQGGEGIGVRNDFAKSKMFMDTGANFSVVKAEHLGSAIIEPAWLNYCREWGPKVDYDIAEEMQKAVKVLPGKLKTAFRSVVQSLPDEVLKEEGPIGPKMKGSWIGDEV
ncbi:uncharacterized protein LOC116196417 [Punica granatum]|uniref:Uncharacterized protein LOC116196417 n=1 Tax=Punica granatum TaxID=22663 RepID=A0A6P8CFW6_PUNGR|nr:uncharacterized protein LOC116196417 [Punica granatum]